MKNRFLSLITVLIIGFLFAANVPEVQAQDQDTTYFTVNGEITTGTDTKTILYKGYVSDTDTLDGKQIDLGGYSYVMQEAFYFYQVNDSAVVTLQDWKNVLPDRWLMDAAIATADTGDVVQSASNTVVNSTIRPKIFGASGNGDNTYFEVRYELTK